MQSNKPSVPENQKVYIEDEFNDNPIGESESPSLKTRTGGIGETGRDYPSQGVGKENLYNASRNLGRYETSQFRNKILELEFKNARTYNHLYGVYFAPRPKNTDIWDGIIFLRTGMYKDGKFKFRIEFPRAFPHSRPEIFFKTPIYHPLIDFKSGGALDLRKVIPDWKYGECMVVNLISALKDIFHDMDVLGIDDSFNPEAADNFMDNIDLFYEKVLTSVDVANKELTQKSPEEALKFSEFDTVHSLILKKLKEVTSNKEISEENKPQALLNSLLKRN